MALPDQIGRYRIVRQLGQGGMGRIRVTTQLIETPSGTLLWSHAPQVSLQDLFQLQDEVVQGIVDSPVAFADGAGAPAAQT